MFQKLYEPVPVSFRVQDMNRFAVQAELAPGQDFEEFLQRSGTAGQHHRRLRVPEHMHFAFMHVFGDDEPG